MDSFSIHSIGVLHSPFKEKFGAPRQPGEVDSAEGYITFSEAYKDPNLLAEIDQFSHLWLHFVFHQSLNTPWRPKIRPPRLGGNKKVGVFASRSPVRPNYLGMSAVKNLGVVNHSEFGSCLKVGGIDIIDQTPIIDIKPYLPHSDSISTASNGYAPQSIERHEVYWEVDYAGSDKKLIEEILQLNPLPGYTVGSDEKLHGMTINNLNIQFTKRGNCMVVKNIRHIGESTLG